jgi:hypothetical protein
MDMVRPLLQLLGHKYGSRSYNLKTRQLELISGMYANIGDWICASPDGELFVVENTKFHELYEEIDEAGQPPPTAEHEGAVQLLTQGLDTLLIRGLRLSLEENPSIFRERDELLQKFHRLLADTSRAAVRHEQQRIKGQGAGPMKLPTREM